MYCPGDFSTVIITFIVGFVRNPFVSDVVVKLRLKN